MKIVTDSAADLSREEADAFGIRVAPLHIRFPEGEIASDQITPDEFYTRLKEMEPEIPTTSQPSSGVFAGIYQELAKSGEQILSVHISSGLSGTLESARVGAEHEPGANVTLVDTKTLSGGQRYQVLAAAQGARAGWSMQAILERLKKIQAATETVYTLETLRYLARGGRIGRVQALAGALLRIKPIIGVDKQDGKYNSLGRERTLRRALESIREHMVRSYGSSQPVWVCVLHGQFHEQAEALADLLGNALRIEKLEIVRISPVLGVHTGPGVVGASVIPIALMEGLEVSSGSSEAKFNRS